MADMYETATELRPDVVPPTRRGQTDEPMVLDLVVGLCQALVDGEVRYCHWKSNEALDRSASGENDLDLLVRRTDVPPFLAVLDRLGFKEARLPGARDIPGVIHHYGLDEPSGRLVHVHWQSQLVLGDDMTKSCRIPMEELYLASAVQGPIFAVPSAEVELAVFVVRMTLKHGTWDALAYGRGRLGATERRELAWLRERADMAEVLRVVREDVPGVDESLWLACLQALEPGSTTTERIGVARRLRAALAPHSRYSRSHDTFLRVTRRATWGSRRYLLRQRTRKTLVGGGAVIGIVGGDGAGKSSAVQGLTGMLSAAFATKQMHLGKPRRSLTTLSVKGPMYVARRFGLFSGTLIPAWETARSGDDGSPAVPGTDWVVWHVLNARDRYREYTRARRFAGNGGLVVCDRFPLPELTLMDGSRTRSLPAGHPLPRPVRTLCDIEQRAYSRMTYPDILVVLRVDPAVAVARRHDEDEEFVRRRNAEVWERDWTGTPAVVVDATQPRDAVLREVVAQVWSRL